MSTIHYIELGNGKQVRIANYVATLKAVFSAPPDVNYPHGLTTWWQTSGKDIRAQFRESIHDRINTRAGEAWRSVTTDKEIEERRDAWTLRDHHQHRIIIRKLNTPRLNKRFAHLLYTEED